MQNLKCTLLASVLLALPLTGLAQTDAPSHPAPTIHGSATIGELERIQADTVLYEARAARNKAMLNWQQSGGAGDAVLPAPIVTGAPSSIPGPVVASALPRITEISGSNRLLRCRLRMADGSLVEASAGQKLPGTGYTVATVTDSSVSVTSPDGKIHNLLFSGDAQ
ncbi:type IV pilus biogenesis protein PilP [Photorhabdus africana]|uniref:type IV pilus biogenesis protein PilP n=1 Tax=Photorhabdus africana TaxID=3097554 RepID=UPI002B4038A4|nr:type IV pilus biogenesis protein PilP [Photorhabdus sp. CRI-LC]